MPRSYKGLPPGTYTKDNLPPPGPEVQKILDRVKKTAERLRKKRKPDKLDRTPSGHFVVGTEKRRIEIKDEGIRRVNVELMLAALDKVTPFQAVPHSEKTSEGIKVEDKGRPGIKITDKGRPGIKIDDL